MPQHNTKQATKNVPKNSSKLNHKTTANAVSVKKEAKHVGLDPNKLPQIWKDAYDKYESAGGGAEKNFGNISQIEIKSRNGVAVHKSEFDPTNDEDIISVRFKGDKGHRTAHISIDGMGTSRYGDAKQ